MTYDYLRVAMHGHFDNKLALRYSYNGSSDPTHGWEASLPDPEAFVRSFMGVRDCYVMWSNSFGRYFSMITTSPVDPTAGRVMVTLLLDRGDAITGRQIYTALNQLKKAFFEDGNINDKAMEAALKAAMLPEKPMHLPSWDINPDAPAPTKPMGFRTYLSTRELEGVFAFPAQKEYETFRYVIMVSATSSLRPGVAIDRITQPVKKVYDVLTVDGVVPSQTVVPDGARFTLTFNKEGFAPRTESITAGVPSPYVRYEGGAIVVKAPADSGVGFVRKVRMEVASAKGGVVTGYTVSVNDRPVNTMEGYIELTEADLQPGRKIVVRAASNNFQPLTLELDPAQVTPDTVVHLRMVPFEQGIRLRLDFGEGRVMEQEISLEKNTPEYSQLRSGNFHGFRAHRLSTTTGAEVYNVDVRAAGKPMAPVFENVSKAVKSTLPETKPVEIKPLVEPAKPAKEQPKAETPESKPEKKKEEAQAPEPAPDKKAAKEAPAKPVSDVPEYAGGDMPRPRKMRWGLLTGVLAVVAAICCFIVFMPEILQSAAGKPEAAEASAQQPQGGVQVVDSPVATAPEAAPAAEAQPAQPAGPDAALKADADYLNSTELWDAEKVSSPAAKALFEALANGDIDAFVKNAYFTTPGITPSDKALKVADLMWKAKGSDTEKSNQLKMKAAVKNNPLKLHDLYEDLARVKPKEPNKEPLPGAAQ